MLTADKPDSFDEISQSKAKQKMGRYFKEKWYSEHFQLIFFKYFV